MTTSSSPSKNLEKQEAIDLWLKGKSVWNEWAAKNPHAEINFSHVDFSHIKEIKK